MEQYLSYKERLAISRQKRAEQLKRRIVMAVVVFLVFMTTLLALTQKAAAEENVTRRKTCTSIEVQQGDTLWGIAKTYYTDECTDIRTYIDTIKKANNMYDDKLISGQSLIVPYYKVVADHQ